mgnify:FL=1
MRWLLSRKVKVTLPDPHGEKYGAEGVVTEIDAVGLRIKTDTGAYSFPWVSFQQGGFITEIDEPDKSG